MKEKMHATKTKKKKYRSKFPQSIGYSYTHELLASPTEPIPISAQQNYFMLICQALAEINGEISIFGWNTLSEMVNLMQTFVMQGTCDDKDGLVTDAVTVLVAAGKSHLSGQPIYLYGVEKETVRAIAMDFIEIAKVISHREMVKCHRATQVRIDAQRSKKTDFVKKNR